MTEEIKEVEVEETPKKKKEKPTHDEHGHLIRPEKEPEWF